jgi:phosphotransferase system HPr (HPr) family protein
MYSLNVTVLNKYGIHARPSAAIVREATKHESDIKITNLKDNVKANAKSILELLLLCAFCNTELTVEATGNDEVEAVSKVVEVIKNLKTYPEEQS